MPYLRDTATILSCEPAREHDAWVTLYGREHGKMDVMARGARLHRAKHLGHLEPFQTVEVMIAKGRAFDKLAVARVIVPRLSLRKTLPGLALARACVDLTEQLSRPGETHQNYFLLLSEALAVAERLPAEVGALRVRFLIACFGWQLLRASGFAPAIEQCARCQSSLNDQSGPEPSGEGWLCASCVSADHSVSFFPALTPRLLSFASSQPLSCIVGITAPIPVLYAASEWIATLFRHAPLKEEPAALHSAQAWLDPCVFLDA